MKEYIIELDDEVAKYYESIAELAGKVPNKVLEDTLLKVMQIIVNSCDIDL